MPKELIMPTWFFGMDVAFQLVFTLVTLAVSFYAFKIYKLTGQRQSKLFGISFLFFAIGYFIQSFFNFAIISTLGEEIILFISLISLFLSANPIYLFYALSSLLLAYIVYHYANNYSEHKKTMTFITLLAFISLLLSHVHHIFAKDMAIFYIIGNFLGLVAYILILINLILVNKK
jgi:hypothetical protein